MRRKILVDINKNEQEFQAAYDNQDYNKMWTCLQEACENIAKKIYKSRNVIVSDEKLKDIVTDATAYCMKFVRKGVRPKQLSSYCYLRVLRFINNKSLDEGIETSYEYLHDKLGDSFLNIEPEDESNIFVSKLRNCHNLEEAKILVKKICEENDVEYTKEIENEVEEYFENI